MDRSRLFRPVLLALGAFMLSLAPAPGQAQFQGNPVIMYMTFTGNLAGEVHFELSNNWSGKVQRGTDSTHTARFTLPWSAELTDFILSIYSGSDTCEIRLRRDGHKVWHTPGPIECRATVNQPLGVNETTIDLTYNIP